MIIYYDNACCVKISGFSVSVVGEKPSCNVETDHCLLFRYIGTMDVDLTLESEKFAGTSVVRAFFLRNNKESNVYNETLTMNQQTDPQLKCTDVTAYLIVSQSDHPIQLDTIQ